MVALSTLKRKLNTICFLLHFTSFQRIHYKNERVALTQLGLSQLQVHYPTMCIQTLSWVKATVVFLQCTVKSQMQQLLLITSKETVTITNAQISFFLALTGAVFSRVQI